MYINRRGMYRADSAICNECECSNTHTRDTLANTVGQAHAIKSLKQDLAKKESGQPFVQVFLSVLSQCIFIDRRICSAN